MKSIEHAASQIKELIQHSRTVLVMTHTDSADNVAAALAFAESIKKFGRQVILAAPTSPTGELAELSLHQKFVTSLEPKSLVISLNYQPGSIAKVNYGVEGDKFNLVIVPNTGNQISSEGVSFSQTGQAYDVAVVIGVADLALLGDLYESEQAELVNTPVINIDRHPANTQFGKVNAVDPDALTSSELIYRLLDSCKLPITQTSLELLLLGLRQGTQDFATATSAIFDLAATISRRLAGEKLETSEEKLVGDALEKIRRQAKREAHG